MAHIRIAGLLVLVLALVVPLAAQRQEARPAPAGNQEQGAQKGDQAAPKDEVAEIDKLIADGLAAWRAKDEAKTADLLQKVVAKIQSRAAKDLAKFLPTKAAGWTFEEPSVDSGSWGNGENAVQWSNAQVEATHDGDEMRAHIQLSNSPQIYQSMQAMVQVQVQMKEILRQQGKDIDVKTKNGFQVFSMIDEDNGTSWIVGKRIFVSITVDKANRANLDKVIAWIDLAGLSKLDGQ